MEDSKTELTVGWIGTGVMGGPMFGHLIDKHKIKPLVYTRTKAKAEFLVNHQFHYHKLSNILCFLLHYISNFHRSLKKVQNSQK